MIERDAWGSWSDDDAGPPGGMTPLAEIEAPGGRLRVGDHVRLRPKGMADAFDLLLSGRSATIESIEQDYEDRVYLAVTIDDDPGKDYGQERRPAHRFFYGPDEVELLNGEDER